MSRIGRPQGPYAGRRIRITGGPRAGQEATIVRLHNGQHFEIELDCGSRHSVGRQLAEAIDGSELPAVRKPLPVPERVAELLAFGYPRVVVYRTNGGTVRVAPYRGQDVGPGLVGVYAQGVTTHDVEGDLR
jgi:hypothetical protein